MHASGVSYGVDLVKIASQVQVSRIVLRRVQEGNRGISAKLGNLINYHYQIYIPYIFRYIPRGSGGGVGSGVGGIPVSKKRFILSHICQV